MSMMLNTKSDVAVALFCPDELDPSEAGGEADYPGYARVVCRVWTVSDSREPHETVEISNGEIIRFPEAPFCQPCIVTHCAVYGRHGPIGVVRLPGPLEITEGIIPCFQLGALLVTG
jgi:hypothetical protein